MKLKTIFIFILANRDGSDHGHIGLCAANVAGRTAERPDVAETKRARLEPFRRRDGSAGSESLPKS